MHLGQPRPFKMLMLQRQNPHLNISCCYQLTDKYEDVCKNFAEILGKMLGAVVPKHQHKLQICLKHTPRFCWISI
jgi:hypothetical protein